MEKSSPPICVRRVAGEVTRLKRDHGLTPGLAVVLVGNDPASEVYVRSKHKQTQAAGMESFEHGLPRTSQDDCWRWSRTERRSLRARHSGAIAVAKGARTEAMIAAIDPAKDVDGLIPTMPAASLAACQLCRHARRWAASS